MSIKSKYSGPWLLADDFNETTYLNESNGNGRTEMEHRFHDFSNWVDNNHLMDLDYSRYA